MTDRRNPYVLLGVRFGASADEARSGFARASRRLRRQPDAPYSEADLTWALHQIEQILMDPTLALHVYRVPGDTSVMTHDIEGVFRPPPIRMPRRSPQPDEAAIESARRRAASERLRQILAGAGLDHPRPYDTRRST